MGPREGHEIPEKKTCTLGNGDRRKEETIERGRIRVQERERESLDLERKKVIRYTVGLREFRK